MSRCSSLITLFVAQIFFGIFKVTVANEDVFESMSFVDRRNFFGSEDGLVPEYEIVQPLDWYNTGWRHPLLKIPFHAGSEMKTVVLNIVEDHELVGSRTTGIWFAKHDPNAYQNVSYTPRPDIFTRIGGFQFYQNKDENAAITIFESSDGQDIFSGVVDNYTINSVPYSVEKRIKERSGLKFSGAKSTNLKRNKYDESLPLLVMFKTPITSGEKYHTLRHGIRTASRPDVNLNKRTRRDLQAVNTPDVVFPKLLISADYYLVSEYLNAEDYVMDLMAQFNVADMTYRKVDEPQIRLTITGIILAQDELATPYIAYNSSDAPIDMDVTLARTGKYFKEEQHRFPFTQCNVVIVMVKCYMTELFPAGQEYNGTAYEGGACGIGDNIAVVEYLQGYENVPVICHELAHLFNVEHDDTATSTDPSADTYVMHASSDVSSKKFDWSSQSTDALRLFFRSDDSTCMHERPNKVPDSVKSMQGTWLTLHGQCLNEFANVSLSCYDDRSCDYYGCSDNDTCDVHEGILMKGSTLGDGRQCIDGKWVRVLPSCEK